jgi:DNA polymerase-3 subunit gamma/tau
MSYLVLARKWRPKKFSEVVGQQHVLRALINGLDQDRLHHAFLFSGTRGVGKTTLSRIFAKSLNCEEGVSSTPCGVCQSCVEVDAGRFVDLIEVDAASRTKVDDTRELLDNVQYAPSRGRYKVYLIDEVHMLSTSSFNALLKTLEEPPPHVKFLFATTDPQKLPVTILSRCLQFNLRRLERDQIANHLAFVLEKEAIKFELDALTNIAKAADGSMRDALSLLDQAISYGAGNVLTEHVEQMLGTINQNQIYDLVESLLQHDGTSLLQQAHELAMQGRDFVKALDELLNLFQKINTVQLVPNVELTDETHGEQLTQFANQTSPELIQLFYQITLHGKRDLIYAADPKSGFEMTLLRLLSFQPKETSSLPQSSITTGTKAASSRSEINAATSTDALVSESSTSAKLPEPSDSKTLTPELNEPHQEEQLDAIPAPKSIEKSEEVATEVESTTETSITLNADNWTSIIGQLKLTAFSRQLADNSAFVGINGNQVNLHISQELAHLATEKACERLQSTLSKHLGSEIKLNFQDSSEKSSSPTLATERAEQEKTSQQQAINSIHSDPAISAVKAAFSASVIESTIRPVN